MTFKTKVKLFCLLGPILIPIAFYIRTRIHHESIYSNMVWSIGFVIFIYLFYIPITWFVGKFIWPIDKIIQFQEFEKLNDKELFSLWREASIQTCGRHSAVEPKYRYLDLEYPKLETCMVTKHRLHYDEQYFMAWTKLHRPDVHKRITKLQSIK